VGEACNDRIDFRAEQDRKTGTGSIDDRGASSDGPSARGWWDPVEPLGRDRVVQDLEAVELPENTRKNIR